MTRSERDMPTRIIYDTEFIDDGLTIAPISIAMRRDRDGEELYAITDSLATMARAAESYWLRENVLRWLPVEITMAAGYGKIDANVAWDEDHPEFQYVRSETEIRDMVEDFVLAEPNPQLWAYYASYDHVLYAQLFGPMVDLPDGMPMYTMDVKQEAIRKGYTNELPLLPELTVNKRFGGTRMEHHAMYDVWEEQYRLNWLDTMPTKGN